MAHKLTQMFKKKPQFQGTQTVSNEVKEMFEQLSQRIDKVEQTLEELVNKKD